VDESTEAFARDGRDHAIKLLDAFLDPEAVNVHAVDVVWTSPSTLTTERPAKRRNPEALSGTRTLDPLLTMEVLYQLS
jgi:hypothetical protein